MDSASSISSLCSDISSESDTSNDVSHDTSKPHKFKTSFFRTVSHVINKKTPKTKTVVTNMFWDVVPNESPNKRVVYTNACGKIRLLEQCTHEPWYPIGIVLNTKRYRAEIAIIGRVKNVHFAPEDFLKDSWIRFQNDLLLV